MIQWFGHKFPYTNEHELNLDWIIDKFYELENIVKTFTSANQLTFADPILWDITSQYSKNTIVLSSNGDAFLSLEPVPEGIELNNTTFWLEIFNFAEYVRTANSNLTVNVETNTDRASKQYNVDDWLLYNDVLYKVIATIPSDGLIIIDTNIVHFTVEDFCRAWSTYMVNTIAQYKADIDASELAYKNEIDASELAYKNLLDASVASTIESLQSQLNTAIAGVTVDSEVINARVDMFSITRSTIRDAIQFDDKLLYNLASRRNDLSLNFFNKDTCLIGYDIVSATGSIITSATYNTSEKIYLDFTKRLFIKNSSHKYVYCYTNADVYLGRINTNDTSDAPSDVYPTIGYIRILIPSTDDISTVMLTYWDTIKAQISYIPYNPLYEVFDQKAVHNNIKYGNLFNPDTIISGYYVGSNTDAVLISDADAFVTDKIFIDGSKPLTISGSTNTGIYQYAYCYTHKGLMVGRVDCSTPKIVNTVLSSTIEYIRVNCNIGDMPKIIQGNFAYGFKSLNKMIQPGNIARRKFKIMSYNTGDFSGIGISHDSEDSYRIPYMKLIASIGADLMCYQFDISNISGSECFSTILRPVGTIGQWHGQRNYDYFGFMSNFDVQNDTNVDYDITPTPSHSYFETLDIIIDGVPIHICNIHVEWKDNDTRQEQLNEIIINCNTYQNCIVLGDFNPEDYINEVKQSDNLTYAEDLALFTAAGFTPLNANDDLLGVLDTYVDGGPYDNILIKGNIQFCNFEVIKTDWMNDHYPVVADLIITE